MAYVRITGELIDSVKSRVNSMLNEELRQFQLKELTAGSPEHAEVKGIIVSKVWGDHLDLKEKMPAKWCVTNVDSVNARFVTPEGQRIHDAHLDVSGESFPPGTSRWGIGTINIAITECGKVIKDWLRGLTETEAKINEVTEKYKSIRTQLIDFLESHTSLNGALKDLPELEMYVGDRYMARYREKVVRNAPAPKVKTVVEEMEIDKDLLASTAIAARLKGVR